MKAVLYDYDVYPLVFPAGDPTEITVRPLGQHVKFPENVKVTVHRLDSAAVGDKPIVENRFPFDAPLCGDGCLRFT